MSETTTELDEDARPPEEQPQGEQPQADAAPSEQAKPEEQKPERKQAQHLRARLTEANRRAEEAEARAARAEALLAARKADGEDAPAARQDLSEAEIEARVQRKLADRLATQTRQQIIQAGVKEFGEAEWNDKTATVHAMGAMAKVEFMDAISDLPEAHRVIAALADDPEQLTALLAKPPAALAAALGRMSAEFSMEKPKKEISKVSPPIKPVTQGRVAPEPDPSKMTAQEYIAFRNRTAPKHLGGEGKAA